MLGRLRPSQPTSLRLCSPGPDTSVLPVLLAERSSPRWAPDSSAQTAVTLAATLAAEGHTNREIAERLFVTPKTIEMHLGNVFRKLHVEGRSQLPRLLPGA